MAEQDLPQIYLITPPDFELSTFPDQLAKVLDSHDIACVRVALGTRDEDRLSRAADAIREVCYPRDIALVMSEHVLLANVWVWMVCIFWMARAACARSARIWVMTRSSDHSAEILATTVCRPAKTVRTMWRSARSDQRRWATEASRNTSCSRGGQK